jgi:hypothetical protein
MQGMPCSQASVTSSSLAEHKAVAVGRPQPHLTTTPRLVRRRLHHVGFRRQGARVVVVNSFDRQVCDVTMVAKLRRRDGIWTAPEHKGHISGRAESPVARIWLRLVATEHINEPRGGTVEITDGQHRVRTQDVHASIVRDHRATEPGANVA